MSEILDRLLNGHGLSAEEAEDVLLRLTGNDLSPAWAGALLAALRAKGESAEEIRGFASGMRRLARRPRLERNGNLVDVVGTGGDGSGSLNLSTGSALLAAACGLPVVKHGNRSVSSRSGSADVLEALGVQLPLDEILAGDCLRTTGFTFLFAPYYHPAMARVAPVRRSLRVRTIFNIVGPLSNPAEPSFLLVGAYSPRVAGLMADALSGTGIRRAFVVHGSPGWDEPTPVGPFLLFDVHDGRVFKSEVDPADYGLPRCGPGDLAGGDASENARSLRRVFDGERGPHRDALLLGGALVLQLAGVVDGPGDAVREAALAIDDGRAGKLLADLSRFTAADGSLDGREAND